jgi:hypothetical protein
MFDRKVSFGGLCVLALAISAAAHAASFRAPRTLHPNELWTVYGGGVFSNKCCQRDTSICEYDADDERACELNAGGNDCESASSLDVFSGNKKFCTGPYDGHSCSEITHSSPPPKCQEQRRCSYDPFNETCDQGMVIQSESAPETCTTPCP